MTGTLKAAVAGDGKNVSSSRLVMLSILLVILALGIGVGFMIAFQDDAWARYEGWLDWLREFAMVAVAPYAIGKVSGAVEARRNGGNE